MSRHINLYSLHTVTPFLASDAERCRFACEHITKNQATITANQNTADATALKKFILDLTQPPMNLLFKVQIDGETPLTDDSDSEKLPTKITITKCVPKSNDMAVILQFWQELDTQLKLAMTKFGTQHAISLLLHEDTLNRLLHSDVLIALAKTGVLAKLEESDSLETLESDETQSVMEENSLLRNMLQDGILYNLPDEGSVLPRLLQEDDLLLHETIGDQKLTNLLKHGVLSAMLADSNSLLHVACEKGVIDALNKLPFVCRLRFIGAIETNAPANTSATNNTAETGAPDLDEEDFDLDLDEEEEEEDENLSLTLDDEEEEEEEEEDFSLTLDDEEEEEDEESNLTDDEEGHASSADNTRSSAASSDKQSISALTTAGSSTLFGNDQPTTPQRLDIKPLNPRKLAAKM